MLAVLFNKRAFCESEAFPFDSLAGSDVQIFSNSYTRTQLSVQALLRGLLRDKPHLAPRVEVLAPDRDIINSERERAPYLF